MSIHTIQDQFTADRTYVETIMHYAVSRVIICIHTSLVHRTTIILADNRREIEIKGKKQKSVPRAKHQTMHQPQTAHDYTSNNSTNTF